MHLLLRTWSTDEHENLDYDFAIVELRDVNALKLAEYLKKFKAEKEVNQDLREFCYASYGEMCNFYKKADLSDLTIEEEERMQDIGWIVIPDDFPLPDPEKAHMPEQMFLNICNGQFYWEAHPEYSAISITTESVDSSILAKLI